jgi:hypothetical protein
VTIAEAAANLRPEDVVARAHALDRDDFEAVFDAPLLLVRVEDPSGEVAEALRAVCANRGVRVDPGIGFHTVTEQDDRASQLRARAAPAGSFGPGQLQVRLIRAVHFAVPLRKRADETKAFTERISLGRARNNDVVLRHESVSKFHAWFSCDERGAYYVADASSRNGTKLNGQLLAAAAPVQLREGDLLRFGSSEALFCSAGALWDALRQPAGAMRPSRPPPVRGTR